MVMGPQLFTICINNLDEKTMHIVSKLADNTRLGVGVSCVEVVNGQACDKENIICKNINLSTARKIERQIILFKKVSKLKGVDIQVLQCLCIQFIST